MSKPKSVFCCWGTPGRALAMIAVVLACASDAQAVSIDTVTVGNPGNAGDTQIMTIDGTTGYGVVGASYSIGKYEVTAGQYTEFLNAVAKSDPYGLYNANMDSSSFGCQITRNGTEGSYTYDFSGGTTEAPGSTAEDWGNRPVNYVSWGDSARFANWLHNDQPTGPQGLGTTEDGAYDLTATSGLFNPDGSYDGGMMSATLQSVNRGTDWQWAIPSEDEWYKAAYYDPDKSGGAGYWDYATGTDSVPSNVLDSGGNNATFGNGPVYFEDLTIDSPFYRTEAGAHENSESPYGTFDMMGNVLEWNEALISDSGAGGPLDARGLRGGNFYHFPDNGLPSEDRKHFSPIDERFHLGFRVVTRAGPVACDFNSDSSCNFADINEMLASGDLVAGVPTTAATEKFDLVDDNRVDDLDILEWLSQAASENGHGSPYLRGDSELDRDVDLTDYNMLVAHFDPTGTYGPYLWEHGNFYGDGQIDLGDYNSLATNFSPLGYDIASVPEPAAASLFIAAVLLLAGPGCHRPFRHR